MSFCVVLEFSLPARSKRFSESMISDMCDLGAYGISPKAVEVGHTVSRLKSADLLSGLPEHFGGRRRIVLGFTRAQV
jgi:hypothetical protein